MNAVPFSDLKPGDQVVYYMWHHKDQYAWGHVDKVRSNEGGILILDGIAGWRFRVSDGNPEGYEEHPQLIAYLAPTTPALIARVRAQDASVKRYQLMRADMPRVDWHKQPLHVLDQVWELTHPNRGFVPLS